MKLRHIMLATAIVLSPAAAFAQDSANIEGRVKKLEKEVRAVQRVVFPGGAGKYFEPEIKPEGTSKQSGGTNSNAAAAGLNSRIDSLEAQLAELTGQVEQQGNKLRTMETRLKALEAGIKTADVAPATTTATPKPAATSTMSARAKEVAAVEKPSTGDAFEDNYNYGYRLWAAKFYPEAQTQLQATVDNFPKHGRVSFARNLLGRSWLDDGKPNSAIKIFYANYKDIPDGGRAPESLYFLGVALTQVKQAQDACKTFAQLEAAFPGETSGRLAGRLERGRARAKCS